MKEAMLFGHKNVGPALSRELESTDITSRYIVTSRVVRDSRLNPIAVHSDWRHYADKVDIGFIAIPSNDKGAAAEKYALHFLEQGKPVVSCEKGFPAYRWHTVNEYKDLFRYTASVGGATKMLKAIDEYDGPIEEIVAVANGTLNFKSCRLAKGVTEDEIVAEILGLRYAEGESNTLRSIIVKEMDDLCRKAVIMANRSGMFTEAVTPALVAAYFPTNETLYTKRAIVKIAKNAKEKIVVGYIENTDAPWLPDGVNNILYINGEKRAYGPGAGPRETAQVMVEDAREVLQFLSTGKKVQVAV